MDWLLGQNSFNRHLPLVPCPEGSFPSGHPVDEHEGKDNKVNCRDVVHVCKRNIIKYLILIDKTVTVEPACKGECAKGHEGGGERRGGTRVL